MARFQYIVIYWLPVILYCLLIFLQSSFSIPALVPKFAFADKLFHFGAYGVLGALFLRAFNTLHLKNRKIILILSSILASVIYGMSDELHQLFVPHRDASFMDIIADMLGSIFGVLVSYKWL